MDKGLMSKNCNAENTKSPYHCSLIVVANGHLEFAPNIIRINDDDCICRAFGKIMSILDKSNANEVYVTFEKPEKDIDVVRSVFLDRVIHFGETLGDQVKGRSPKKLKTVIEVPNVVHMIVHVLNFNMILISSP